LIEPSVASENFAESRTNAMLKIHAISLVVLFASLLPATNGALDRLSKAQSYICKNKPDGSKQPNPMSCNLFFACTDYGPEEGYCPDNMLFDIKSGNCVFENDVFCNKVEDSSDEDMDCPNVDDADVLTHKTSITHCERYVVCLNSFGFLLTCPPGLWWNQNKLACDNPKNVKCAVSYPLVSNFDQFF
jgi:Chitin binding Peritrophin-A domain